MESTACNQDEPQRILWETTPENIQVIRRFPKPHDDLFKLAQSVPYWWQLANSAPVLAFMVARCWYFDSLPRTESEKRVGAYLLMKRTAICDVLGFPDNPRTLRLLSKFEMEAGGLTAITIRYLKILRLLLRWEPMAFEILEHEDQIRWQELYKLATGTVCPPDLGTDDLGSQDYWDSLPRCEWFFKLPASKRHWLVDRCCSLARNGQLFSFTQYIFLGNVKPLHHFRNERKALAYIDDYQRKITLISRSIDGLDYGSFCWPDPPIHGNSMIKPILSLEELESEGEELQHCIGSTYYKVSILHGYYYIYRMELPCRCTIGIFFYRGKWELREVRGKNNVKIKEPEILTALESWLTNAPTVDTQRSPRQDYLQSISKVCGLPLRYFGNR